jgi:hypothetical protein
MFYYYLFQCFLLRSSDHYILVFHAYTFGHLMFSFLGFDCIASASLQPSAYMDTTPDKGVFIGRDPYHCHMDASLHEGSWVYFVLAFW